MTTIYSEYFAFFHGALFDLRSLSLTFGSNLVRGSFYWLLTNGSSPKNNFYPNFDSKIKTTGVFKVVRQQQKIRIFDQIYLKCLSEFRSFCSTSHQNVNCIVAMCLWQTFKNKLKMRLHSKRMLAILWAQIFFL